MMKNKVIEMMAKDWNAYADAFGKKDDCVYVVVDNSNDSVEKFYKTFNGAALKRFQTASECFFGTAPTFFHSF